MSKNNPFENIGKQLKERQTATEGAKSEKIESLMKTVFRELENLSNYRMLTVPNGIINVVKGHVDKISNIDYSVIRQIADAEIESYISSSKNMNPTKAENFRTLWRDLADRILGKVSYKEAKILTPIVKLAELIVQSAIQHQGNEKLIGNDIAEAAQEGGYTIGGSYESAEGKLMGMDKIFINQLMKKIENELDEKFLKRVINKALRDHYLQLIRNKLEQR